MYGYIYSSDANENDVMDYFAEKESPYQKRDRFLGIPFNSADNYMLTGEGVGGGFRMDNKSSGHFFPNVKKSHIDIFNIRFEVEAGLNVGGGGDIGYGEHNLSFSRWSNLTSFADHMTHLKFRSIIF